VSESQMSIGWATCISTSCIEWSDDDDDDDDDDDITRLDLIIIVLAHRNNSLHSDTLFWFR